MLVDKIQIEPTPVGIGYQAWVPGHEERYGTAWGRTPDLAWIQMLEQIEDRDWRIREYRREWDEDAN